MTEEPSNKDFQARASAEYIDATDAIRRSFRPHQIGVGVVGQEDADTSALLLLGLVGRYQSNQREEITIPVLLDTERTVGLIVQLQGALISAGVEPAQFVAMMMEATGRHREAHIAAQRESDNEP